MTHAATAKYYRPGSLTVQEAGTFKVKDLLIGFSPSWQRKPPSPHVLKWGMGEQNLHTWVSLGTIIPEVGDPSLVTSFGLSDILTPTSTYKFASRSDSSLECQLFPVCTYSCTAGGKLKNKSVIEELHTMMVWTGVDSSQDSSNDLTGF